MTDLSLNTTIRNINTQYVSLSEEIRHFLLSAFISGELIPGARVNDMELAKKLDVSRTPVREAIRGLQTLGIIEALPARVTRIVRLSFHEFEHAKTVWVSLYRVLLSDAVSCITDSHIAEMTELCKRIPDAKPHENATITFQFFDALSSLTDNPYLKESVHGAACRVRLGHYSSKDDVNNYFVITFAQAQEFLAALREKNLTNVNAAFDTILGLPSEKALGAIPAEAPACQIV